MNPFIATHGTSWPLHIEPGYLDTPVKKMGRPATGYGKNRTIASIERAQRMRFLALGLTEAQQDEAVALCRRGYTPAFAVRLAFAGMRR